MGCLTFYILLTAFSFSANGRHEAPLGASQMRWQLAWRHLFTQPFLFRSCKCVHVFWRPALRCLAFWHFCLSILPKQKLITRHTGITSARHTIIATTFSAIIIALIISPAIFITVVDWATADIIHSVAGRISDIAPQAGMGATQDRQLGAAGTRVELWSLLIPARTTISRVQGRVGAAVQAARAWELLLCGIITSARSSVVKATSGSFVQATTVMP
jgi:hypothetical protein